MTSDEVMQIYGAHGTGAYFGERVTVTEHSLQAAYFARKAGAGNSLVLAALLHDIGHLLEDVPTDIADWTSDAGHERVGSAWLAARFGEQVWQPVRLHVPAKRYLCGTDPDYRNALSEASIITLQLQGGAMTPAETKKFETEPYFQEAVQLRRWDDMAKIVELETPGLEDYRPLIEELARLR